MRHIWEGNWVLPRPREPGPEPERLHHRLYRPPADRHQPRPQGRADLLPQCCSHRGAMICRHKRGNKSTYTCPFHGWTFSNTGQAPEAKGSGGAGYPESFKQDCHSTTCRRSRASPTTAASFSVRSTDVKSIEEHLGESAKIIDLIVDQSPEGLEVLRGNSQYIYDGNWKLQPRTARTATMSRRFTGTTQPPTQARKARQRQGRHPRHGRWRLGQEGRRLLLLRAWPSVALDQLVEPAGSSNWDRREELTAQYGQAARRLDDREEPQPLPLPERLLMDQFSSQIRMYRPISVDKDRGHDLLHRAEGRERRGPRPIASASTRIFQRLGMATAGTTSRSSAPARSAMARATPSGTTSRAAPRLDRGRRRGCKAIA